MNWDSISNRNRDTYEADKAVLIIAAIIVSIMTLIFSFLTLAALSDMKNTCDENATTAFVVLLMLSLIFWGLLVGLIIIGFTIRKKHYKRVRSLSSEMQNYIYGHTDIQPQNEYNTSYDNQYPSCETNEITDDIFFIDMMEGHDFEHYCAKLLLKNGFTQAAVTPGSGDQGVDILAIKDNIKYAVQCKCFASPLSNKPIQEVHAGKAFYNCHVGVVMTNSTFTPGAIALAQATGTLLWDRDILQQMIHKATHT